MTVLCFAFERNTANLPYQILPLGREITMDAISTCRLMLIYSQFLKYVHTYISRQIEYNQVMHVM